MTFESALSAQYMKAGNRFASPRKVLPDVEVAKLIDGLGLALETGREPLGVGLAYINFWKNCLRRNSVVTQEAGPERLHFCELVQRVVRSPVLVADLKVISRRTGYRARSARQSASDRSLFVHLVLPRMNRGRSGGYVRHRRCGPRAEGPGRSSCWRGFPGPGS